MALTNADRAKGAEISQKVRQERILATAQRREVVDTVTSWADREQLPITAMQTVLTLMDAVQAGVANLPEANTALDVQRLAEAAKTVHSLMRLEMGESTSNVATSNVDKAELLARLGRIQESPNDGPSST